MTKFIVDTNVFITPAASYYNFNIAPSFWEQLSEFFYEGKIVTLDKVIAEITNVKNQDEISKWVSTTFVGKYKNAIVASTDEGIAAGYQKVINHIITSSYYKYTAVTEWSQDRVADGWIIAAALENGYTVCTLERYVRGLNEFNPSKTAKIPNVIKDMGGSYCNLFEMMEKLNFKL